MDYKDMKYDELRNELGTRGLQAGGSKDDLQNCLLANDKAKFKKYGALNDPEGINRAALIDSKSEKATTRAESRYKTQIARAKGTKEVQLENIETGRMQEVAVLQQIIAGEKVQLDRGGRELQPSAFAQPPSQTPVTGDSVVKMEALESPQSEEMEGVQTSSDTFPNACVRLPRAAGSRSLPIDLDPYSPEQLPIVRDTFGLEPLHDSAGLFVPLDAPRHTNMSPLVRSAPPTLENAATGLDASQGQVASRSLTPQSGPIDLNPSASIHQSKKRRASNSHPDHLPAARKQRTSPRGASPEPVTEGSPVLESLPEGTHYVFISADDVPVTSNFLLHMRRMLSAWVDVKEVRADRSGYTVVFGYGEEEGKKARDCAKYFNAKNKRFEGRYELKMAAKTKAGNWGLHSGRVDSSTV